ncbi:MAG: hypothetical protein QME65_05910, partial [Candidatus Omnitrophota bacterium]|nr:hypothetical protein [Candidatus Omnitrophota bacterium]
AYFTCRAVLEEDINMCDKIQYPDARDGCSTTFNNIYMLSQIIKNKQLTTRALDICRQLEGSPTDENCREVSRACLTGDASQLSTLPYLTGEDLAFISGDDKYCQGMAGNNLGQCRDLAFYTSAIRSGNDKRCSEIKNIALQTSCRVYFNNDKGICESLIK